MLPDSTGAGGFRGLNLNSWPNFGGRFFWISPFRGWSFGPQFLSSCPMGPVLGEVELSGLCVRPTSRRRVCSKRTPRGEPARGNGQEINWQSEPLFFEEVHQMVNFFKKRGSLCELISWPFLPAGSPQGVRFEQTRRRNVGRTQSPEISTSPKTGPMGRDDKN